MKARRAHTDVPVPAVAGKIISVDMSNDGWAHFEGGKELGRIKHPCIHITEKTGSDTDKLTLDLFEKDNVYADLQRHQW